jgi:hypothetical protein
MTIPGSGYPPVYSALYGLPAGPAMLSGNLLPAADSAFESALTGNWAANSNANAPLLSGLRSFGGAYSLQMTATAAGNANLLYTPFFPCALGQAFDFSAYAYTQNAGRTGKLTADFYTAGHGFISDDITSQAMTQNAWTPLVNAFTPPSSSAVFFRLLWEVDSMAAGESAWLDLVFAARLGVQVLVSWQAQPFAAPLFADMTPFTRADQPITMTRGRQDNVKDVQPGALSLTMANDLGWFTEQNTGSPFYPSIKIGRRIQVNAPDEAGVMHTRFDGQVNDIELNVAPTGMTADAVIQAADIMAYLSRQDALSSWTKEEILADNPVLHWTLDDPAGSSAAVESSGNNGPPLQVKSWGLGGSYAFAGGTAVTSGQQNGMESQTWPGIGTPASFPSVYFAQSHSGSAKTLQQNWQLQAPIAPIGTGAGQNTTIEGYLIPDVPNAAVYSNAANYNFYAFSLASTRTGAMAAFAVSGGASSALAVVTFANHLAAGGIGGTGTFSTSTTVPWNGATPGPVHVALVITGSGSAPSGKFYVNGSPLAGTVSIPPGTVFNWVTAGGPLTGYQGWLGQLSCLTIYNYALSAVRIANHAVTGGSGRYNNRAGNVVSTLARLAGLPAFWNNTSATAGLEFLDYYDLQGSNALAAMQVAEQADGGLVYADAQGRLNYSGRETRMGAGGPSLTLATPQFEADLGTKVNDQYLANEAAYASAGIPTGTAVVNTGSQADFGSYAPSGTAQSPTSLPLLSFSDWTQPYLNAAGGTVGAFIPDNLNWAGQWAANALAQPSPKAASARVDMLTLPQSGPDGIPPSQLYALDVGSVIALTGLPVQFPNTPHASEYFVEGVSETIQGGEQAVHDLVIYTSPASQGRAWIAGDPVYGQLDSTAVIGRSGQPGTGGFANPFEFTGQIVLGPPYPAPSYSGTMNASGFAGALDQAGIWYNLAQQMQPPLCAMAVAGAGQTIPNGAGQPGTRLVWDTVYADTVQGAGWLAGFPNWYFVLVPGWYQLHAVVTYSISGAGRRAAWFLAGQRAAKGGTGPVTGLNIIGSAETDAGGTFFDSVQISAKLYCTLGTAIAVQTWQDSGGNLSTATGRGGSLFSARFLGDNTTVD